MINQNFNSIFYDKRDENYFNINHNNIKFLDLF